MEDLKGKEEEERRKTFPLNFYSWIHSRVDLAEEEASELEGMAIETV